MHRIAAAVLAAVAAATVASPSSVDARVAHGSRLAVKKADEGGGAREPPPPLLATLVQTHTGVRVPLDERAPTVEEFSNLVKDRVTGEHHDLDPRLLGLLRALARAHPTASIELVSGYRSPKRNEMMRKKGHHVASRSQHSLGNAVDFRVVVPVIGPSGCRPACGGTSGEERGIDPRELEREIRALGWDGGIGVYTREESDWFVHADVGRHRRWTG